MQLVHEERRIFAASTSRNPPRRLTATKPGRLNGSMQVPRLKERRDSRGTISGGEQQMLAIARALVREPKILLSTSRSRDCTIIVRDLLTTCRALAEAGQTILLVEQNISAAMTLADRVYILNNGHIVEMLTAQTVRDQPQTLHRHLGV